MTRPLFTDPLTHGLFLDAAHRPWLVLAVPATRLFAPRWQETTDHAVHAEACLATWSYLGSRTKVGLNDFITRESGRRCSWQAVVLAAGSTPGAWRATVGNPASANL